MVKHWFILASQLEVRIVTESEQGDDLKFLRAIENPLGRSRNQELVKKQAGMGLRSTGQKGALRYSETKRRDPHEEASQQFAREVSQFLEQERLKKSFDSLTVVAEPHFLGMLKAEMEPALKKSVMRWLKKDLQKTPHGKLADFLLPIEKSPIL